VQSAKFLDLGFRIADYKFPREEKGITAIVWEDD
jgi:hypothetical protein